MSKPLRVRVAIPHYFRESAEGSGYGSGRPGATLARSIALARCLAGLLNLQRSASDLVLNIGERCINPTGPGTLQQPLPPLELELHVFSTDGQRLDAVLATFAGRLQLHDVALDDPRTLALAARDFLIHHCEPTDLSLYLEDDLVVHDSLFLDKQAWFLQAVQHRAVLMPHRYEPLPGRGGQRLLVDGPLRPDFIGRFTTPQPAVARGRFRGGEDVCFDRTANPHAGLFCVSGPQLEQLRRAELPREGFVGPLETAATLTVLAHFPVLKPSLAQRDFLWIEHGHPSFQNYVDQLPRQQDRSASPA